MKRTAPATWVAATGMFLMIPVWCPAADQGSQANPNRIATHPPFHMMAQTTSPKAEQQQPTQVEVSQGAKTRKVTLPTYIPPPGLVVVAPPSARKSGDGLNQIFKPRKSNSGKPYPIFMGTLRLSMKI